MKPNPAALKTGSIPTPEIDQPVRLPLLGAARGQLWLDLLALLPLCILCCYLLVTIPHDGHRIAATNDNAWYLNRGYLMWRGVFDDVFVYNMAHPVLVGAINLLVRDLPLSAIIVSWLALSGIMIGTYGLGRVFYSRQVGWLAVLVIVTNLAFQRSGRLLHPFLMMQAVLVSCTLAYGFLLRRRTMGAALLLGFLLTLALYTRFEGVAYAVLIPVAGWIIYRDTGDWRRSLRLCALSAGILVIGLICYGLVLIQNADTSDGAGFALFAMLRTNPLRWDELSHRWQETLTTMSVNWPVWAWAVIIVGILWSRRRYRAAGWLFGGLVMLHVAYLFLLSTGPALRYTYNSLPFIALLFAGGLWQFHQRWPRLKVVVPLVMIALMLPGLISLSIFATSPPPNYRDYSEARNAQAIDDWLLAQGWQDTEVFTLCQAMIPFTHSNFHMLYRLSFKADLDARWWNSPANLLPTIREHNKLWMSCAERVWFPDWIAYFENPAQQREQLQEVGRVGDYVFFRVIQRSE